MPRHLNLASACVATLFVLTFSGSLLAQEFEPAVTPDVKRIVLYNSGVGQLQHGGVVDGNRRILLNFKEDQVNDVLKSLVFKDTGGGTVHAIEYQPSPDPEDIAAETMGDPMTVAQFLQSMRGESVSLKKGDTTVTGTIYGVENRTVGKVTHEVVVLLDENGLGSHPLIQFESVQFEKAELREKLRQALQGVVKSRSTSEKSIELLFRGEGKREIAMAYIVDMPIWRMTYRLSTEGNKCFLQGWAHVDNVTTSDWNDVELELRSGKPFAFRTNIYSPLMARRSNVGNGVYEFLDGLNTQVAQFAKRSVKRMRGFGGGGVFGGGGFGGGGGGLGGGVTPGTRTFGGRASEGASRGDRGIDPTASFKNQADTRKITQTVIYRLNDPISIGAGRSSALPVFSKGIPGEVVCSVDMAGVETGLPLQSVEIENTTDFSLLSGPLSIIRAGDFVGDGKLPRVDVKQKTIIDFGVDRPIRVTALPETNIRQLLDVEMDGEKLVEKVSLTRRLTYEIKNLDTEDRVVLLQTSREKNEDKTITPEPDRRTDDRLIFRTQCKAGETKTVTVDFGHTANRPSRWTGLTKLDRSEWDKAGVALPQKDKAKLLAVIEVNRKIESVTKSLSKLRDNRNGLISEQGRLRDNLKVLKAGSDEARPTLEKFTKAEKGIEVNDKTRKELETRIEELRQERLGLIAK